jgi:hypothetical protein
MYIYIVFLDTMWILLQTKKKHNIFYAKLEAIMEGSNMS